MPFIFNFPDIGEGLSEGVLLEWYVKVGQTLEEGDLLAKVETDKVIADIPTPRAGVVLRLHGEISETIFVGNPLVEIAIEGEALGTTATASPAVASEVSGAEPAPAVTSQPVAAEVPAVAESGPGVVGNIEVATGREVMPATGEGFAGYKELRPGQPPARPLASPLARAFAKEEKLSLESLSGTGVSGRILKKDVEHHLKEGGRTGSMVHEAAVTEDLSSLRKTIARRMVQAKFSAPHATTFEEVNIASLAAWRADQKAKTEGTSISYLAFIAKAVCIALLRHPKLNCRLDMEASTVTFQPFVHLGIAVDTPEGLIVPVIRNAHQKSVRELAAAISDLARRARSREITLDDLRGGSFTITNFGSIAGLHAAPIINVPEVAILGVGRILEKPLAVQGEIEIVPVLPLSLAVDHRIVDGGDAARFLKDTMDSLEDPLRMILD
jgi:pyruvate dehydrogenase E2 component (dihydrolipoamide acetyltransferase)